MLTTPELFKRVVAKNNWYQPLGLKRNYASNLKAKFLAEELPDSKQQEILLKLGYEIENPTTWKEI